MKKLLILALVSFAFTSCGITSSLYYWGGMQNGATTYENLAYKNYDKQTPESLCKLICMYEDIVSNPGGTRRMPPPGICAEYGYMLLIPENAAIFAEHASINLQHSITFTIQICILSDSSLHAGPQPVRTPDNRNRHFLPVSRRGL